MTTKQKARTTMTLINQADVTPEIEVNIATLIKGGISRAEISRRLNVRYHSINLIVGRLANGTWKPDENVNVKAPRTDTIKVKVRGCPVPNIGDVQSPIITLKAPPPELGLTWGPRA